MDDLASTQPGRPVLSFNPPGMNLGQIPKVPDRELLVRQRDGIQQRLDKHVGFITKELEPDEQNSIKEAVGLISRGFLEVVI
jgi:hypothetical protein